MNTTAIVILNYKNYKDTINCINSIFDSKNEKIQIIVVDNDSKNQSLETIFEEFNSTRNVAYWNNNYAETAEIILVQVTENNGYAAGNNVGLKIGYDLGHKYLMVLNNDTLFIDNALSKLKDVLNSNESVFCVGPLLLKGDRQSIDYNCAKRTPTPMDIFRLSYFGRMFKTQQWEKRYYYLKKYPQLDKYIEVDIISGSCMLFDAQKFNEIDFFDGNTFLYYEEAIVSAKGKAKGYHMAIEPNATVIHLGAQTTKTQKTSLFLVKCEFKSLKLYLQKYRKLNPITASLLLLNSKLFISISSMKNKLTQK